MITTTAFRFQKYMAQICGEDDVYGLNRKFLRFEDQNVVWGTIIYNYGALADGVYEASVKYYSNINDDSLFFRDRNIIIIFGDDYRTIPYNSIPKAAILEIVADIKCGTYVLPPEKLSPSKLRPLGLHFEGDKCFQIMSRTNASSQ